jgi:AbrB family looped-hinge helix DNA binding protein
MWMIALVWHAGTVVDMMGPMVDVAEFHTTLSSQGRLVLPAELRRALDLHAGDVLSLTLDQEGVVRLATARQLANQLWAAYADAEEAPVGTAATQLREMRDAEAAKLTARHERISARRAAAERTEDELEAELMADLATGLGVEQPA